METSTQTKMKIRLFGAFRNLLPNSSEEAELSIDVPRHVQTIGELKSFLKEHWSTHVPTSGATFDPSSLVQKSVFANERAVLTDDTPLALEQKVALLPPVSGG